MTCPACGSDLTDNYCAHCGQRSGPPIRTLRALTRDVLEDSLDIDGKLLRTLSLLFLKPGYLTREYVSQRISPYVRPFRLYLWISVLFFLAASIQARTQDLSMPDQGTLNELRDSANARAERGERPPLQFGIHFDPSDPNWAANAQVNLGNERLNRSMRARLLSLRGLRPEEALRRLMGNLIEDAPKVMFLLLPLYALLLKLLYVRSRRYYAEHFVFALHGHAFAFGVFLLMTLLSPVPLLGTLLWLWLPPYFWLAMKRVYQEGWLVTTVKWLVVGQLYLVLVVLALAGALATAVLTL